MKSETSVSLNSPGSGGMSVCPTQKVPWGQGQHPAHTVSWSSAQVPASTLPSNEFWTDLGQEGVEEDSQVWARLQHWAQNWLPAFINRV